MAGVTSPSPSPPLATSSQHRCSFLALRLVPAQDAKSTDELSSRQRRNWTKHVLTRQGRQTYYQVWSGPGGVELLRVQVEEIQGGHAWVSQATPPRPTCTAFWNRSWSVMYRTQIPSHCGICQRDPGELTRIGQDYQEVSRDVKNELETRTENRSIPVRILWWSQNLKNVTPESTQGFTTVHEGSYTRFSSTSVFSTAMGIAFQGKFPSSSEMLALSCLLLSDATVPDKKFTIAWCELNKCGRMR